MFFKTFEIISCPSHSHCKRTVLILFKNFSLTHSFLHKKGGAKKLLARIKNMKYTRSTRAILSATQTVANRDP